MDKNDKEMQEFIEAIKNNTPNSGQFDKVKFDEVKDFEEDLFGGKSFKEVRNTLKKENKK
jgi:hypothetical protein